MVMSELEVGWCFVMVRGRDNGQRYTQEVEVKDNLLLSLH